MDHQQRFIKTVYSYSVIMLEYFIYPVLVLRLFCFNVPCRYTLLNLRSFTQFNAHWLAAFYYADPLFVMGISFMFSPTFPGVQLSRKTRAGLLPLFYSCKHQEVKNTGMSRSAIDSDMIGLTNAVAYVVFLSPTRCIASHKLDVSIINITARFYWYQQGNVSTMTRIEPECLVSCVIQW